MRNKIHYIAAATLFTSLAIGNELPTSNNNAAYSQSNVQAQIRLNLDKDTEVVHFVRDTNDPKIVTKTYILKHADPYAIRPYLREMVQATRVMYNNATSYDNKDYYNVYGKEFTDANGNKFYQNVATGVECIVYNDGTGAVIISAEEYRFADGTNGMGIDSLVAKLDQPGIINSSGQPKYIYFPANRPAKELQTMVRNVGANLSNDTVELIGGKDKVELDEELNCLFFNTALYSRKNIEAMLRVYDVPHPEVRMRYTVYEISAENDGSIGLDFQAWKNNQGAKFFSTGGVYRDNWAATFAGGMTPTKGYSEAQFFSFNPEWNSRYLDFLVSKGKGKVTYTGEIAVQNGSKALINQRTGLFLIQADEDKSENPDTSGPKIQTAAAAFEFAMVAIPSVAEKATTLELGIYTKSLIGYKSDGSARTSVFGTLNGNEPAITTRIMLGNQRTRFYVGGVEKTEVVRSQGGLPFLKDLPFLGFLFATERESTKKSQLVIVADCEVTYPETLMDDDVRTRIEEIKKQNINAGERNSYGYNQWLLAK